MSFKLLVPVVVFAGLAVIAFAPRDGVRAGEVPSTSHYKVLAPIRHGNLTVFPVVAAATHDTRDFLTLDEGLRSGDVVVTEYSTLQGMVRRRQPGVWQQRSNSAQVNTLVLVNNSKRPLILLAGEIVTGGKQDRVIGKDRLIPAESDPVDLVVFCVEPGRWTGASDKFNADAAPMAQPAVRAKAMADKNQAKVWEEVGKSRAGMMAEVVSPPPALAGTSSYARVMLNKEVQEKVDSVAAPLERDYRSVIQQLREHNAVGVIVAVNGEIIWADIFASTDLLQKYWPKLARSYAAEAIVTRAKTQQADEKAAQAFLDDMEGRHQTVESEPGLYRHTEISGDGFKAFELTSLLPKTIFDLHVAKMTE
jgi:ARG/rhodanese/phosphatase superfamily protein